MRKRFPLPAILLGLFPFAQSSGQTLLLNDGFDSEPSFTANPNADQTGALAPASYQVGTSGFPNGIQRRGTGALELGFDGTSASGPTRVFTNADFVTFANTLNSPIRIRFVINAAPADWVGFLVGTSNGWMDGSGADTELSALFQASGGGTRWVNGSGAAFAVSDTSSEITLELSNTAGTGSAFNGTGSVAKLWRGTTNLGTFTLDQLNATNARFAFTTWNGNGGAGATIDDFSITATASPTLTPRWSGNLSAVWDNTTANFSGRSLNEWKNAGVNEVFFGDLDANGNAVENTTITIAADGVEATDVIFEHNSRDYQLDSADSIGLTGASRLIKSGSGTLTLTGTQSYTGRTVISGGSVVLAGNDRLPNLSTLELASPGVLQLSGFAQTFSGLSGNGRVIGGAENPSTLTIDSPNALTFAGTLGGAEILGDNLGLVKNGSGSLALTNANRFTGGTIIEDGILLANFEPIGAANTALGPMTASNRVIVRQAGVLTSNGNFNNWLSSTNVSSGGSNAISVQLENGGTLRGANGRITGLGAVTMNGGTIEVSNGLNNFGWFAAFNLGGDITVQGTSPSFITTSPGAGTSANFQLASGNNTSGGGMRFLQVDDVTGDALPDLVVGARLANGTLVKQGAGTVEITSGATGTAFPVSWEMEEGLLRAAPGSNFEFRVTNALSNRISGAGAVEFLAPIVINTTVVTSTVNQTWPLIAVNDLTVTFGPEFAVTGFADADDDGTWTKTDSLGLWAFSEQSGELSLTVPVVDDFVTWSQGWSLGGDATADADADGLNNFMEYAFGLSPIDASSVNPIVQPLDPTTRSFRYSRRLRSLSSVNYLVQYSTDLIQWKDDTSAVESLVQLQGEVETVTIQLSPLAGEPLPDRLFLRVRATTTQP